MFIKKVFILPIVLVGFFSFNIVFAAGPFSPNQTLDPDCAPGDINCIVNLGGISSESDPFFSSSPSFGIGTGSINNWNNAFSWGNHATQGYLTGTKISQLNGLSSSSQIFAIGTSGTGFSITSTGNTHTFNIPFSTGGISGLLSGADWTLFNNKQNTLTAGVGIDISGNTISASTTTGWQIGGSAGGGQVLGSNDSALPFMSNGNTMMQLDNSNLSLSNNMSFVDRTGRNGLFIGNNNTYGDSDNVLGIGETLDIRIGNKNIFTLGNQVDHIENNANSIFGGEILSGVAGNNNVFSFGNNNSLFNNIDSIFFGFKNNWSNESNKFIIGSNDKRFFQVDIDTGEMIIADNVGNVGEALVSQGPGQHPTWQSIGASGVTGGINGLTLIGSDLRLGGTLNQNTVITHAGRTLFYELSSINTQNGITMGANVLTTGTILNIDSSYNLLNSTNGLLRVANTSASSSGVLARFQANSTLDSGVTFLTNGNVGIGDSSPSSLFSVGSGDLFQINTSGFALAQGGTAGTPSYTFVADPDTGMYRPANNSLRFAAGGNTVGRMDTAGWMLGDGGTAPVSLVHIGGGANASTFRMTNNLSGNTASDGFFINYTGTGVSLNNMENAEMSFWTNNLERMRILSNGNIAISQTGATEKLEVNGGIKIGNSGTTCNAGAAGTIRWNGTNFQGCTGTGWLNF